MGDTGDVTTSCQDVTMLCDAYLSVRVLRPEDPTAPYISVCKPLTGAQRKLCSIAGIDLPQPEMAIPAQTLEIQMAVFPADVIRPDPDTGEPVCPLVEFGATGLPKPVVPSCDDPESFSCPRVPAVGGRTFYHPGDDKTVIDLGCTNLALLTDAAVCTGSDLITVDATINDFDNLVSSVDKTVADRLNVGVGEPTPQGDSYVLDPGDSRELDRTAAATPTWHGVLELMLTSFACLEVLEVAPQTTTALTCVETILGKNDFKLAGYYLKKATLAQILSAIGMTSFPDQGGLVIGMVVNENTIPRAGEQVACNGCTIHYLNASRTSEVLGGTSSSGVFVSTNAPFGTEFSLPSSPQPAKAYGGIVEGKVTIVVLQYRDTVIEEP